RIRHRTTTSAGCGASGPDCRWCSPSGPAAGRRRRASRSSRRRSSAPCGFRGPSPDRLAYEASGRYGYPPGFLARYFEKLRYRFGEREREGLVAFLELAVEAGELNAVPELRFVGERVPA